MSNDDNDSIEGYDDINDNDDGNIIAIATLLSAVLISPPFSERFCTLFPVEGHSCKPIVHIVKIKMTYKNKLLHKF